MKPRARFLWVNDQVDPGARVKSARARIGEPTRPPPKRVPRIELTRPRFEQDPVSGVAATGYVRNESDVEQRRLVIYAVARRGGKVVAAGRGQINRLKPRKRARYNVFFIGNPRGASVSVTAPPTVLQ